MIYLSGGRHPPHHPNHHHAHHPTRHHAHHHAHHLLTTMLTTILTQTLITVPISPTNLTESHRITPPSHHTASPIALSLSLLSLSLYSLLSLSTLSLLSLSTLSLYSLSLLSLSALYSHHRVPIPNLFLFRVPLPDLCGGLPRLRSLLPCRARRRAHLAHKTYHGNGHLRGTLPHT